MGDGMTHADRDAERGERVEHDLKDIPIDLIGSIGQLDETTETRVRFKLPERRLDSGSLRIMHNNVVMAADRTWDRLVVESSYGFGDARGPRVVGEIDRRAGILFLDKNFIDGRNMKLVYRHES